jgi:hypothetical protein
MKSIESVLEENTGRLMSIKGIIGVSVGEFDGKPCIRVFVSRGMSEPGNRIPSSLEGYPVLVEEKGRFRALGE